ncbi:MAG: hypothetical protein IKD78_06680 [Bacteroidales bacterium]|nr:hypothetical protein [Bacteroidales bacterium]
MPRTIEFHNTPDMTRAFVNNWLTHARKQKRPAAELAVLEDVLTMIDVAMTVLEPGPAEPAK